MGAENQESRETQPASVERTDPKAEFRKAKVDAVTEAINDGDITRANNLMVHTPGLETPAIVRAIPDETMEKIAAGISKDVEEAPSVDMGMQRFDAMTNAFENDGRLLGNTAIVEAGRKLLASGELHPFDMARILKKPGIDVEVLRADPSVRDGLEKTALKYKSEDAVTKIAELRRTLTSPNERTAA